MRVNKRRPGCPWLRSRKATSRPAIDTCPHSPSAHSPSAGIKDPDPANRPAIRKAAEEHRETTSFRDVAAEKLAAAHRVHRLHDERPVATQREPIQVPFPHVSGPLRVVAGGGGLHREGQSILDQYAGGLRSQILREKRARASGIAAAPKSCDRPEHESRIVARSVAQASGGSHRRMMLGGRGPRGRRHRRHDAFETFGNGLRIFRGAGIPDRSGRGRHGGRDDGWGSHWSARPGQ